MRPFLLRSVGLAALALVGIGCGGAESASAASSSSGPSDAGDGRVHPPGDGTHVSEASACETLKGAQAMRRLELSCTGTSRICPDALRAEFATECLEYDQGSVQGCLAYYNEAKTCDDLSKAINDCAVTSFAGSQPKGCPAP